MKKREASVESWLTPEARDALYPQWGERIVNIIRDLSEMPHLRYAYAVGEGGQRLTRVIGSGGRAVEDEGSNPEVFYHLARIVEDYLVRIGQPAPAHVTVELEDEMLFVGSTGDMILVACFDGAAARGYIGMKLAKRISHLRKVFQMTHKREPHAGRTP